jgi:hypothetical protein
MSKRYICFKIGMTAKETENLLNDYASLGWKLVCSYAPCGTHLIMEKDIK